MVVYSYLLLEPITTKSEFKSGSTIPVKFTLKNSSGINIATSTAKLFWVNTDGTLKDAASNGVANKQNFFRYDISEGLYIFNLSTKGITAGEQKIRIVLDDGTEKNITILLK